MKAEEIILCIPFRCTYDPAIKTGKHIMHMKLSDCCVDVVVGEGEEKKRIGRVSACIGGGLEIEHEGKMFYANTEDIWSAYAEFIEKKNNYK